MVFVVSDKIQSFKRELGTCKIRIPVCDLDTFPIPTGSSGRMRSVILVDMILKYHIMKCTNIWKISLVQ